MQTPRYLHCLTFNILVFSITVGSCFGLFKNCDIISRVFSTI